jgi:cytidylate kinase
MNKTIRIAIDGPGGAGKSTIAMAVAKALQIDYIDTGSMYRAVALKILKEGIDLKDQSALQQMLDHTDIDFSKGNIYLDGEIISDRIRTPEISAMASACSALPMVRKKLVALQRQMGESKSIIMDGRDIGTNVLPHAEYKFFLTASPEERARRRTLELQEKGQDVMYSDVLADIEKRDYQDSNRALNPLTQAEDALLVNTTGIPLVECIQLILSHIK